LPQGFNSFQIALNEESVITRREVCWRRELLACWRRELWWPPVEKACRYGRSENEKNDYCQ